MNFCPEKMRKAMVEKGLTQAEISRKSGLTPTEVSYLLSGRRRMPRVSTLYSLSKVLNLSMYELIEDDLPGVLNI